MNILPPSILKQSPPIPKFSFDRNLCGDDTSESDDDDVVDEDLLTLHSQPEAHQSYQSPFDSNSVPVTHHSQSTEYDVEQTCHLYEQPNDDCYSYQSSDEDNVDQSNHSPAEEEGTSHLYPSDTTHVDGYISLAPHGDNDEETVHSTTTRRSLRTQKRADNIHIKSKLYTGFMEENPSIIKHIKHFLRKLLCGKTRLPEETGDGIVIKAEAAYNPNNIQINVERKVPIKEIFGTEVDDVDNLHDGEDRHTVVRKSYSTGSGNVTTGTPRRFVCKVIVSVMFIIAAILHIILSSSVNL